MSAAELRKAAETLRERASNASTGDGPTLSHEWFHDLTYMSRRYEVAAKDEGTVIASNLDRWTAEFIATMHPGVGLALADWLDYMSDRAKARTGRNYLCAIKVARLINGEV